MNLKYLITICVLLSSALTLGAQIRVIKNVGYAANKERSNTLNVYRQKEGQNQDVIIFIHGGSWSSGKKETYWWLGRNLAKKGVVAVIIDYPLAPSATYKEMAISSAKAVKWVRDSITNYGGNPNRIFLMGHSAGAHLCELINADPQYFSALAITNPIKGVILNDPFGLDMEEYLLKAEKDHYYDDFIRTFSADVQHWRSGSPLFYAQHIQNPHLIFYGTKTYEAIQLQSKRMYQVLQTQNVPTILKVIEGKKHVGMISQMIWGNNTMYPIILDFLKQTN